MQVALTQLFSLLQKEHFEAEINTMRISGRFSKNSPLASLNPILDNNGLLRVGGRLLHSELPEIAKHPVLLKGNHHVITLLVRHTHAEVLRRRNTDDSSKTSRKRLVDSWSRCCSPCDQKLHNLLSLQQQSQLTFNGSAFSVQRNTFTPFHNNRLGFRRPFHHKNYNSEER